MMASRTVFTKPGLALLHVKAAAGIPASAPSEEAEVAAVLAAGQSIDPSRRWAKSPALREVGDHPLGVVFFSR
jgi:hypothetical protein